MSITSFFNAVRRFAYNIFAPGGSHRHYFVETVGDYNNLYNVETVGDYNNLYNVETVGDYTA